MGIKWVTLSSKDLRTEVISNAADGYRTIVIIDTQLHWPETLATLPEDSVILIQLSDETLLEELLYLNSLKSIHCIFRNYSVEPLNIFQFLFGISVNIIQAKLNGISIKEVIDSYRYGYRMRQRAQFLTSKSRVRILEFPLGYTNKFSTEIIKFNPGLATESSFFSESVSSTFPVCTNSKVSFVGGGGAVHRRIGLRQAAKLNDTSIEISDFGWNGTPLVGLEAEFYVTQLLNSAYTLCPPGTVSNESFRYFEAIICGSIPITSSYAISQGTRTSHSGKFSRSQVWAWNIAITRFLYKSKIQKEKRVRKLRSEIFIHLSQIRQIISEMDPKTF